jgi:hypothetical protein
MSGCSLLFDLSAADYIDAGRSDAGQSDARADGAALDAPGVVDGPGDADAGLTAPCAVPHTLCEDFDDGGTLSTLGWDPWWTDGGSVTIDNVDAFSGPRSTVAEMQGAYAEINRTVASSPSGTMKLSFEMRVESHSGKSALAALVIGTYLWRLNLADVAYTADEWTTGLAPVPLGVQVENRWVRVDMNMSWSAPKAHGTILFDGATVFDRDLSPNVTSGNVSLQFGEIDGTSSASYRVRYDNIVFDKL